jgi:5'-3' exonuclease
MDKVAIIDGDGIPYVASNYCAYRNLPIEDAFNLVDNLVENIITATKCDDYLMFFTGFKKYRDDIVDDYKENRIATKAKTQPDTFKDVKKYTIDRYQAYYVNGIEADDACGIMASRLDNYVVVSNDKDLLQIEGDHYKLPI